MKLIIALALAVFPALHCSTTPPNTATTLSKSNTESIVLLDSKYQTNISGYNGVRSTDYYFKTLINTGQNLHFDSAWIDSRRYPVFLSKETGNISNEPLKITKGDTILLRVSILHSQAPGERVTAPIAYEGKALIRYIEKDKTNYLIIEEIALQTSPNRQ